MTTQNTHRTLFMSSVLVVLLLLNGCVVLNTDVLGVARVRVDVTPHLPVLWDVPTPIPPPSNTVSCSETNNIVSEEIYE